ncbi:hypothetical protein N658DRAFT_501680 [Parathielavia hyrcaniae]|uniref:Secreted protein n=1 Tax=Parathielavia hyrcaniae TaxID=113614 RepID=A0AAN6SWF0_9PEZI|nr:hypothetical protein N658DRAFT_501680 [Parathielavia hyrcaniae]
MKGTAFKALLWVTHLYGYVYTRNSHAGIDYVASLRRARFNRSLWPAHSVRSRISVRRRGTLKPRTATVRGASYCPATDASQTAPTVT